MMMTMTTVTVAVQIVIQRMNNILFSYDYVFSGCNSSQAAVQHQEDH